MAHCPECGVSVTSDASFCHECGAELGQYTQVDSVQTESESEPSSETDTDETAPSDDDELTEEDVKEGLSNIRLIMNAGFLAILPALGAYFIIGIASASANTLVFWLGIPIFGYVIYDDSHWGMASTTAFWLAIEAFLAPVFFLIFTYGVASGMGTGAGAAGAAIGGFLIIAGVFVVAVPLGAGLYLLSKRLDPE